MKKQITAAEILAAAGFALVIYGVGRLHVESACIIAGLCLFALGLYMAAGKPH